MTPEVLDVVGRTLWGEARGETFAGQVAVAWVIRNRVEMDLGNDGKPDWWGEGYIGVCQKAWQFSCWNKKDPNSAYLRGEKQIPVAQLEAVKRAVVEATRGGSVDPTKGATHYYNPHVIAKAPAWTVGAVFCGRIGAHLFYRGVK